MEALEVVRRVMGEPLITSYMVEVGGRRVVIDPGPATTFQGRDADVVVCTHLHLDHCGSAGHYGVAVYAHARYVRHLVDPTRLWEAAQAFYGPLAPAMGQPLPSPNAVPVEDGARLWDRLEAIYTPGHAPHHVMYLDRDTGTLYVGDGAGVRVPWLDAVVPTTPPPFRYEEYMQSLRRARALGAVRLCYAHYSCTDRVELLAEHEEQMKAWVEVLSRSLDAPPEEQARALAKEDPNMAKVLQLGGFYRQFYLLPTIAGFTQYLRSRGQ